MDLGLSTIKRSIVNNKKYKKTHISLLDDKVIQLDISKSKLNSIMYNILTNFCNTNIFGYNNYRDFYWAKIYDNDILQLYIEINIIDLFNEQQSKIIFKTKSGDITILNAFINNFNDIINNYKTSEIMKYVLEEM